MVSLRVLSAMFSSSPSFSFDNVTVTLRLSGVASVMAGRTVNSTVFSSS